MAALRPTPLIASGHCRPEASLNDLAGLYLAEGRFGEAEPLYGRALEARARVLGAEHPDTLESVNNLAFLYHAQGRYTEAEPLYRRALESSERILGAEHPNTLSSVNNLAALSGSLGRYADAEPLYRRALEGCQRVLGEAHPDTINVHLDLAGNLVKEGRLATALAELRIIDGRLRTFVGRQLDTTGSELVRRQRLTRESRLQDVVFTLALAHPDSAALSLAADILLRCSHSGPWITTRQDRPRSRCRPPRPRPPRCRYLPPRIST